MKNFILSSVLAIGLALATGEAQAQKQNVPAKTDGETPAVSQPPTVEQPVPPQPVRPPSGVLVKPSGVLNKPSGVLNKPSGVLNKPSGVLNKPPGVISAVPDQTQPAPTQNFVGGQRDFRRFRQGGNSPDGNFRRGDFRRGHRSSFIVVYVNGAACWYPVYTAYPYYYAGPLPPTSDSAYAADTGYVPLVEEGGAQVAPNYGEVGRQWGQDLRREVAAWDQFVEYLRAYIINATPAAQADFRETFIASYGVNGAAAYDKAAEQAVQPASSATPLSSQGPKIIDMQSGN